MLVIYVVEDPIQVLSKGDYRIGETLMNESASLISFCPQVRSPPVPPSPAPSKSTLSKILHRHESSLSSLADQGKQDPSLTDAQPMPRKMVIVLVGLKPHRTFWTTSARPSESVLYYQLLNGVPAIVVPVKIGAPLVAWDGLTLEQLWKIDVKKGEGEKGGIWGTVNILSEYLEFCVDYKRVVIDGEVGESEAEKTGEGDGDEISADSSRVKRSAIRKALTLMVIGAVRSGESREVKKEVDKERSGIAMWRIP